MNKEKLTESINNVVSDYSIEFHLSNQYLMDQYIPRHTVIEMMKWVRDTIIRHIDRISDQDESKPERPPIGIMPKKIFEYLQKEKRFVAISNTITRYQSMGRPIRIEWVIEYNELQEWLVKNKI